MATRVLGIAMLILESLPAAICSPDSALCGRGSVQDETSLIQVRRDVKPHITKQSESGHHIADPRMVLGGAVALAANLNEQFPGPEFGQVPLGGQLPGMMPGAIPAMMPGMAGPMVPGFMPGGYPAPMPPPGAPFIPPFGQVPDPVRQAAAHAAQVGAENVIGMEAATIQQAADAAENAAVAAAPYQYGPSTYAGVGGGVMQAGLDQPITHLHAPSGLSQAHSPHATSGNNADAAAQAAVAQAVAQAIFGGPHQGQTQPVATFNISAFQKSPSNDAHQDMAMQPL